MNSFEVVIFKSNMPAWLDQKNPENKHTSALLFTSLKTGSIEEFYCTCFSFCIDGTVLVYHGTSVRD